MVLHPVILVKLAVVGLALFAILLGVTVGIYHCFKISTGLGVAVSVALVTAVPIALVVTLKFLPDSALGGALRLDARRAGRGEGTPAARKERTLLGRTAVAETALHPSGAIRLDESRVIARAETGFIEKGATVKIVKAVGMNVVVREVKEQ